MINLDPIHWACVGLGGLCLGLGIYTKVLSSELDAERSRATAIGIIGEAQELAAKTSDKKSKEVKGTVDAKLRNTIAKLTYDNKRLRGEIASSRLLPQSTQVCTGGGETTSVDWNVAERAIDEFRIAVRGIAEEGDKERAGLNTVKEWTSKAIDER